MNTQSASILLEQAIQILADSPSPDDAALARDALVAFRDGWFVDHRTRAHREPKVPAVPIIGENAVTCHDYIVSGTTHVRFRAAHDDPKR